MPAAIAAHVADLQRYPDPEAVALRRVIAEVHGLDPACVVPGNGSAELIAWLARLSPLRRVVVIGPTFSEYGWAAGQAGAQVDWWWLDEARGFSLAEADGPARLRGADALFLCHPNNPTGTLLARQALETLAARCEAIGAWCIVDEAYLDCVVPAEASSMIPAVARRRRLIVLRSLTKGYAVPGLRLGYLVAAPEVAARVRGLLPAWPLNALALAVGERLVRDQAYLARGRAFIAAARAGLRAALETVPGLQPCPSAANFLLCRLADDRITASALCERMAARGLLLRNGDSFEGLAPGRFIRVAVRTPQDNARLVAALREVMTDAHSTMLRVMVSERRESNHAG